MVQGVVSLLQILTMATAIVAVTNGVVHAIKRTEPIPKRYLPIVAILAGILLGASAIFIDITLMERLWAGGISGLASVGLFELGKNTKERKEE